MLSKGAVKVAVATESVLCLAVLATEEGALDFGITSPRRKDGLIGWGVEPVASDTLVGCICGACGSTIGRHTGFSTDNGGLAKLKIAGSANECDAGFEKFVATALFDKGG